MRPRQRPIEVTVYRWPFLRTRVPGGAAAGVGVGAGVGAVLGAGDGDGCASHRGSVGIESSGGDTTSDALTANSCPDCLSVMKTRSRQRPIFVTTYSRLPCGRRTTIVWSDWASAGPARARPARARTALEGAFRVMAYSSGWRGNFTYGTRTPRIRSWSQRLSCGASKPTLPADAIRSS